MKGSLLVVSGVELNGSSGDLLPDLESGAGLPSKRSVEAKKSVLWKGSLLELLVFVVSDDVDLKGSPEKKLLEEDLKKKE